jgi:hypothetical protein
MEELFRQIAWAADTGLYFLALTGALIIPDICGALEAADGRASGALYIAWFDTHVRRNNIMTGETCYRLRCSLLHQGTTQHSQSAFSRVLFIEPGATPVVAHMNVLMDALNIDVKMFSLEMVQAALSWQTTVVGTEPYETNVKRFVSRYPEGLPPYIGGVPVIS